jgi:hypothetical protein
MKFFVKKQSAVGKIDPRSEKFTAVVLKVLEEHGITDGAEKGKCAHELLQGGIHFAKALQRAQGRNTDAVIESECMLLAKVLSRYGITTETEQEQIIIEFFSELMTLAGHKVG